MSRSVANGASRSCELARARRARGDAQADPVVDREAQVRGARRAGAPPRGTRGREGAPGDEAGARERHADRDRADAGQRGGVPGVDGRRDVAGDRRAQRPGDVRALGGQAAGAGEPATCAFERPFGAAARARSSASDARSAGTRWWTTARGLVQDDPPPGTRGRARMQSSVSSQPTGTRADPADVVAEAADRSSTVAAEGHVGADQVADRRRRGSGSPR